MFYHFQSQADVTAFNIGFNVFLKAWLEIFLANQLSSFINSKITCKKVIMMPIDHLEIDDF